MRINWVRYVLAAVLFGLTFTTPNGVDYEMVRLFNLFFLLFGMLMLGLAFELKGGN